MLPLVIMNISDVDEYCTTLSASIRKKEAELKNETEEITNRIEEIDRDSKLKEKELEELTKKCQEKEKQIKQQKEERKALEEEKAAKQEHFEAVKKREIEESTDVLMEVPDISLLLSQAIFKKSKLLVCPDYKENYERDSILVNTADGKQLNCLRNADRENHRSELEGNFRYLDYVERLKGEIELIKTVQRQIKSRFISIREQNTTFIGKGRLEEENRRIEEAYKKKFAELEQRVEEQEKQCERRIAELEQNKTIKLEDKPAELNPKIAELEKKLKDQAKLLEEQKESVKEKEAIIASLNTKNSQSQATIFKLKNEMQSRESQLAEVANLIEANKVSKNERNSAVSTKISQTFGFECNPVGFKEDSVFRTDDDKIAIIHNNQGKITVQRREKQFERDNFIFWWNRMQLCGWKEENCWCFSVHFNDFLVSSVEVERSENNCDRLMRRGNNIYFSVYDSGKLYKFEFEENKLFLSLLGNIEGTAISLLEHKNAVYVGSTAKKLLRIRYGAAEEVLKTEGIPTDLLIFGDELRTVDNYGNYYVYSLSQNKVLKAISVGFTDNTRNFLAENCIVKSEKDYLTVFDWNGRGIIKIENPTCDELHLLTKTEGKNVLTNDNGIVVFNHLTLGLTHYKGEGVYDVCTNI